VRRLQEGSRINPKLFSCFADESFVGHVARASKCSHPSQAARNTLIRYVLFLATRMAQVTVS